MLADWSAVRSLLTNRNLSAQYVTMGVSYWIKAIDGAFELECIIPTDPANADTNDFLTNFQPNANKPIIDTTTVRAQPPYGSKTVLVNGVSKKLFARFTGQQYSLSAGSNTITYTATYAWAKLIGVECINCEALDTVDFKVYDTAGGTYSGHPNALLQQFSYTLNLPKDFYLRMAQFDADVYAGMVIQMTYVSQSAKT